LRERFSKIRVPDGAHPLVREMFEHANAEQLPLADLAERSGVNRNTLKDWRTRSVPNVANLQAVGNVLGWELAWRRRR
jgi:hypothetical protein